MNKAPQKQAIAAIIQMSDRFLFIKRSESVKAAKGYWCPVTGGIEDAETQEEAVKREVMEEVGLDVVAVSKVCEIPTHDNVALIHFWTTRIISGKATIASNEVADLKWVTIEEMKQLTPAFQEDIEIFENLSRTESGSSAQR